MSSISGYSASSSALGAAGAAPSAPPGGGVRMSPKELEIWLQQQVNKMWERVGASTHEVNQNNDVLDDLSAASAAAKGSPPDKEEIANRLQSALDALPDTADNQERRGLLEAQIEQLRPSDPNAQAAKRAAAETAFYASRQNDDSDMNVEAFRHNLEQTGLFTQAEVNLFIAEAKKVNGMKDGGNTEADRNALKNMMLGFISNTMYPEGGRFDKERVEQTINGLSKGLESDNELKMIYLQQAMSDAQESIQLISNLNKINSDSNKAIINNMLLKRPNGAAARGAIGAAELGPPPGSSARPP
jgi:hypothetical protein